MMWLKGKKAKKVKVFGYEYPQPIINYITLDQTITDPAKMLSGDINGEVVQWIRANSHRVLARKIADGVVNYCRLDDANSNYYYDGSAATLNELGTDVMLKLPEFYWQCVEQETDVFRIGLAYNANPGTGWHKWEGEKTLCGVYEAYGDSLGIYSYSGVSSSGNIDLSSFKNYARARGTGYSIVTWEWHCIMAMLYYCQYGHMNCQELIGNGTSTYSKSTGQTDALGMEDTQASTNGNSQSINFWGLENWWGNKYEWIDNVVVDARVWEITPMDGSATRTAGSGGSSNGYASKMLLGDRFDLICTTVSGSETTGYCDYYYQSSSSSRVVRRSNGSSYSEGGVACASTYDGSSFTSSALGSRLAFYGTLIEKTKEEFVNIQTEIGVRNTGANADSVILLTNYVPTAANTSDIQFYIKNGSRTGTTISYFGTRNNNSGQSGPIMWQISGVLQYDNGSTRRSLSITIGKNVDIAETIPTDNSVACNYPMMVFSANNNGTADPRIALCTFYWMKVYDDNLILTHHYVGGVKNGNYGICDMITDEWFYPASGNEYLTRG